MKLSVMGIDARYSVENTLVLSFMSVWVARCEEQVLGMYETRKLAEHHCVFHESDARCLEEV